MKSQWRKISLIYIIWGILLLVFALFMSDRYCRMVYGGGILYVASGQNEISDEERKYLQERGMLVYAETLDSFPAQIYDGSLKQEEEGFGMDLMDQLALEMGTSIQFRPTQWPDIFHVLESRQADIIQISYSEEREEKYYLTEPLYENRGVVFVQDSGEEIKDLEDLKGKRIAGTREDYVLNVLKERFPELDTQEYNSIDECANALISGEADGLVADEQNIMYYAQQKNMFQDYYIVQEEVYRAGVVFAVRKSDEELGKIINKAVYKLRTSGILDNIQQKWFLQSVLKPAVTERQMDIWLIECILGTLFFLLILFWYIQKGTKALVAERTRELVQERKRLEVIVQSIPQYLMEVNTKGEIEVLNRKPDGQYFLEMGNECLEKCGRNEVQKALEEGTYIQKEIQLEARWYRVTISGIAGNEEEDRALMVMEDITLRRLQEKQNIQDSKMAAIGQLASGISHELKNPLEIICNYCYALKKGILHTEEQIQHTVGIIEDEAKSANKIVDNLLSFVRIAPDKTELTELKSMLQTILKLQENLMKKKKIQTEFFCEDYIWVKCNPEGLKRIFINLIRNAQEAMEGGGILIVQAERQKERVQIEIRDNGVGMDEETQEQMFNPFYTTKSTGTGLGLYLVYHQVQESGGTIEVESIKGKGTVFHLTFPLADRLGDDHEDHICG